MNLRKEARSSFSSQDLPVPRLWQAATASCRMNKISRRAARARQSPLPFFFCSEGKWNTQLTSKMLCSRVSLSLTPTERVHVCFVQKLPGESLKHIGASSIPTWKSPRAESREPRFPISCGAIEAMKIEQGPCLAPRRCVKRLAQTCDSAGARSAEVSQVEWMQEVHKATPTHFLSE